MFRIFATPQAFGNSITVIIQSELPLAISPHAVCRAHADSQSESGPAPWVEK